MKKETVNTFEGGLNKDLNPIVTPNNILSDNLNGTFLTFNGDELSLQNDAGNTSILGPNDIGHVKLSEGFEPLAIKEYGGILYITSVKKAYDSIGRRDPKNDEVEFGSYPSPKDASYWIMPSAKSLTLSNDKDFLYKSWLISEEDFKAGRDISFSENAQNGIIGGENIWRPDNTSALYNIKLLLSLNSGVIDLTDDIWSKFQDHKTSTGTVKTHWLFDHTFNYYCPFNYKGKLLLKVEFIEPKFQINQYFDIDQDGGEYIFKVKIIPENSTSLDILGAWCEITTDHNWLDDTKRDEKNNIIYELHKVYYPVEDKEGEIAINIEQKIPVTFKDQTLGRFKYKITPKLNYNKMGSSILEWNELPDEFKNKFTITGNVIINEALKHMNWVIYNFIDHKETRLADVLALVGKDGKYIDLNQNNVDKPFVIIHESSDKNCSTSTDDFTCLGTYTTNGNFVGNVNFNKGAIEDSALEEYLETKAQRITIIGDALEGDNYALLYFDIPLDIYDGQLKNGSIKFTGGPSYYEVINDKQLKVIMEGNSGYLDVYNEGFEGVYINHINSGRTSYKIPNIINSFTYSGESEIINLEGFKPYYFKYYKTPNFSIHSLPIAEIIYEGFWTDIYKVFVQGSTTNEPTRSSIALENKGTYWYFRLNRMITVGESDGGGIFGTNIRFDGGSRVTSSDGYALSDSTLNRDNYYMKFGNPNKGYLLMPLFIQIEQGPPIIV